MTLQTRISVYVNGLLLVTVALVSAVSMWTTVGTLRERTRQDALGTASLLASAVSMSVDAPDEVEKLVGDQMLVEARLTAHLVAVAEGRAGLSASEVNAILKDVSVRTLKNEFLVAGPDGVARLSFPRPAPGEDDFRFDPDLADQPQAHVFWKLLEDRTGTAVVNQKAQPRAPDGVGFKYVGVSGVDKPRIVQVGCRTAFLEQLAAKFDVNRLVRNVIDAGNLEAIFVADPVGRLVVSSSRDGAGDLRAEYREHVLPVAQLTSYTLRPAVQFRGGSVEAGVPVAWFGGKAGALICRLNTRELDDAIASSIRDTVLLGVGALVAGVFLSTVLSRRVSGPVRALADAAQVIGSGRLDHRVRVGSADEVGVLAESFNRMAGSLETYTRELARTTAEKEVLRHELDIAAEIQRSLLPGACPQLERFDVAAESIPAREVGGDFYDFIPLSDGRWGVVIADASGKGVPAALLMALSRSLIRAYSQEDPSILRALRLANRFMLEDSRSGMFVTCFYAVVDPVGRGLTYVNAGHNPPVVARPEGHVLMLPASGTPLGIIEDQGIVEETCQLQMGDVVVMYTDGVTEALSGYGEQFGMARLEKVARNSLEYPAAEVVRRILTAVKSFAAGQPQFDDMTVVVLKAR